MGGDDIIVEKLKSDRKRGILASNIVGRIEFYGNNKKP